MGLPAHVSSLNEILATKAGKESEASNKSKPKDLKGLTRGDL